MKLRFRPTQVLHYSPWLPVIAITGGVLLYRLGTLLPLSPLETVLPSVHSSLQALQHTPMAAPYTLAQALVAALVPSNGAFVSRLPAAMLLFITVLLGYWLLSRWYGARLALFGGILLATAPVVLHVGRLGTQSAIYPLASMVALCMSSLWHQPERSKKLLYLTALVSGVMLYVPGYLWLAVCVFVVERHKIITSLKAGRWHTVGASALAIIVLLPMVRQLLHNWHSGSIYLGLPSHFASPLQYAQAAIQSWQYTFLGGYHHPLYNLGGLPLVNGFMVLAFMVGIYLYAQHLKASRTRLLASLWVASSILIGFGVVHLSSLLPLIIMVATGGIGYLLHFWLKVFPRNPYARSFGIGLVALVILASVSYSLANYFVAWPQSPETVATFHSRP